MLSLVLGVSVAMALTARSGGGTPAEIGGPDSIAALAGAATRPPADRAGRGEPRTLPDRGGTPTPAGSTAPARTGVRPAAPARTLVPARATSTPAGAIADASVTDEVVRLTNLERAKAGCDGLRIDPQLTAAAQGHSTDMADRGYFSHDTPAGKTPWDRAKAAGYAEPSAENIAMGYRTAADVVTGWMNSPGHRANIVNCASHAVGVGYDPRGYYWTQLFGFV
ncbi:MAG: hypothetical protein V7637_6122 [Mycobacteriales bacterium]